MLTHIKRCIYLLYLKAIKSENIKNYQMMKEIFSPFFKFKKQYKEEIDFLKKRKNITMFPYPFIEKYKCNDIEVYRDEDVQMYYVLHMGKKLYYPSEMTENAVKATYRGILLQQDQDSPHRYFSAGYEFEQDGIFIDVGCAEANMALEVVDKTQKVLLFEADKRWMPALMATFAPYRDKVTIINKYAGEKECEGQTTIDTEIRAIDETILDKAYSNQVYIKIDAEGSELTVLNGASQLMQTKRVMCACCTYHRREDAELFSAFFNKLGYQYEFSRGYAIFIASKELEYPYFRRCLLRTKNY